MDSSQSNHALVLGASGLIGWSVVNQLLSNYPMPGSFPRVTALTNRPVGLEESCWPTERLSTGRPSLRLVSGVDLRCNGRGDSGNGPQELAKTLLERVEDAHTFTHVYYFVFTSLQDHLEEVAVNKRMLENVIGALEILGAPLKFVVFPGGTRGYGIYTPGGTFTPPLAEDMVNNLPPDYAKTVVYPVFRELLTKACQGKSWTWCEICPDAIIGFTPNGSQFSLALHWAQYLSLYAHNHGLRPQQTERPAAPVTIPFPGNEAAYESKFTPVSAKTLACFAIHASMDPNNCGGGRLFNIGDSVKPAKFREIWPRLAAWFGMEGTSPVASSADDASNDDKKVMPGQYIAQHQDVFLGKGLHRAVKAGVGAGSSQLDSVGTWLTFDRQLSLKKLRDSGFNEEKDPVDGWLESFEAFRKAGLIF
ncbi:hypothetical protein JX266_000561 [Neoarthrinium moseri]|nr:hypothetical protein JX266_000561 [Neoarthrinium moseri]